MNDTIYRRDAIQALVDTEEIKGFAYRMLEDRLMEIPSADKQQVDGATLISAMTLGYSYGIKANRPQGKWINQIDINGNTYGRCSICGMRQYAGQLNYCPDCGAMMQRGTDNER